MKKIFFPLSVAVVLIVTIFFFFSSFEQSSYSTLENVKSQQSLYALLSFALLSADIVLPVPSSLVMYTNGLVLGIFAGTLLSFISLMFMSALGYQLGKLALKGQRKEPEGNAQNLLRRFGALAIIITRPIPILAESVSVVCGYNLMEFRKFLLLNAVGYLPVCILYSAFGHFGRNENNFIVAFLIAFLVSAVFWLVGRTFMPAIKKQ